MKASSRLLFVTVLVQCLVLNSAFAAKSHAPKPKPSPAQPPYDQMEGKPLDEVFQHFDEIQKKLKNSKARALKVAYDQLQAKQYAKARGSAQVALGDSTYSDYAHWIIASASLAEASDLTDNEKYRAAAVQAKQAFEHFSSVLNGNPYSPMFKQAPKQLGEAQLLVGYGLSPDKESVRQFEEAFERLQAGNGGVGSVLPEESEAFAKACRKNQNDLCEPWLMRLTEHLGHETDEFKSIAKLFPSVLTHIKGGANASHTTQTYKAPDLDSAAFDDAMASCTAEKWSDAESKLTKFLDEFPRSTYRFRARYWYARTLQERRKKDEAKKDFADLQKDTGLSYYGLLASFAARNPFDQGIASDYPEAAERDPAMSATDTFHLKRAETFLAEKANDLAAMELKEIHPRPQLGSPFVMYLAGLSYRAQNYPTLFVMLTELFQRNYPGIPSDIGLKMIFPIVQLDRIKKYAKENSIDPVLVLSLIKQESAFDPHALSGSGASGLMQIMYFTATETVPGISRSELLEPEHNIKTGTRYLSRLLDKYKGNVVLALAAYNAGPIPVERWVREGAKQKYPMLQFIESIPYKETRDYVSSIIRNYFWYSKLLETPTPKSLSLFWAPYGDLSKEIGGADVPEPQPEPSPSPTPTAVRAATSDSK